MPAIDTIASFQTTVGSAFAAGVMATGDSNVVRNSPPTARPSIVAAFYDSVTSPQPWRVRSPLLHDNVQGIRFYPGQSPMQGMLPYGLEQMLEPQDTLTFELSTAATTGKALAALMLYYPQLPGAAARLYMAADIDPLIKNLKPTLVTFGSGSNTAGIWQDLVLTTTENLLHANTDYAVLGFIVDNPVACVAVKGIDTGNLRISCPGVTNAHITSDYFVRQSRLSGLAQVPVINSANAGSTFLSLISSAATAAATDVVVMLAELAHNLA